MKTRVAIIAAASLAAAPAAFAHHSFAMFDTTKEVTVTGTVKDFQWTNPHVFVQVLAANPGGAGFTEWSIEGGSVNTLTRLGWTRNTIKPGDKVVASLHPMRDGTKGGSLIRVVMPDGRVIGEALRKDGK